MGALDIVLSDDLNSSGSLRTIMKEVSREIFGSNLLTRKFTAIDKPASFASTGIPATDLIAPSLPTADWWHTATDTVNRLDPRILEKVGTLVLRALPLDRSGV